MLIAGTDTSSVSMFYTLLLLAEHQDLQNKLFSDELKSQNKGTTHQKSTNINGYSELPLLVAILSESMRVKPVGPVSLRRAATTFELKDTNNNVLIINPGDNVIVNIARMHQKSQYFAKPTEFEPIRFLESKKLVCCTTLTGTHNFVGRCIYAVWKRA